MSAWNRWVGFWSGTERPQTLALVRVGVGGVLLADLLEIGLHGLVYPLFAAVEFGGWADVASRVPPGWAIGSLPGLHWGLMVVAALTLTLGLFSRSSAVVLLVASAAWHQAVPEADRAVDHLARAVLAVLAVSECGAAYGLDAWRTGERAVGRWSRRLLIAQLVILYTHAGLAKLSWSWLPMGGASALYVVLQDPAVARYEPGWLGASGAYPLTQFATLLTVGFQLGFGMSLWVPRMKPWMVAIGVSMHLGMAVTMELGIFPWLMLALYAALIPPDCFRRGAAAD